MPSFVQRSEIEVAPRELHDWHMRPGAFERLTPAWAGLRRVACPPSIEHGGRVRLELRFGPLRLAWHSRYEVDLGHEFRDVLERGPMKRWIHAHRFLDAPHGGALLEDAIDYELPFGALGRLVARRRVERHLERLFAHRHAVTRADLERHAARRNAAPLRVALSGSTGLVGSALASFLTTGAHTVHPLVRRAPRPGTREIGLDPATDRTDASGLAQCDAVVHLAGESIAAGRWTAAKKRRIRDSRVEGTRRLCEALAALPRPPRVLVSASAIGFYGERGDERLDEESMPGEGFLSDTCRSWEAATEPAEQAGIRVVRLRLGVVLAAGGGALARMLGAFSCGIGGRVGGGRQWMSWIALDDVVGAIHFVLFEPTLTGPVNLVAPEAARNAAFTETLARVLRRPAVLPLPAPLVRAALGEMGQDLLLASTRVEPRKLAAAGFRFAHPSLENALRFELGVPG